jgi:hypothetical protein
MKTPPKNFSNLSIGSVLDRPPDAHLAFYKCRPCAGADDWIAWASLVPMTPASAVLEPAEPLWFDFGATEAQAIAKVKREVETEIGRTEWQRQVA